MESHFSIDGTFIHELVAPLQLPDEHLQFRSWAGPVYFTSICRIFQLYLLIPAFAFAAQPTSATSVIWWKQRSISFSTVFVTICTCYCSFEEKSSSSALIKRNQNSDSHPLVPRAPDGEEK